MTYLDDGKVYHTLACPVQCHSSVLTCEDRLSGMLCTCTRQSVSVPALHKDRTTRDAYHYLRVPPNEGVRRKLSDSHVRASKRVGET